MSLFIRSIALIAAAICGSAGTAHAQVEICVRNNVELTLALGGLPASTNVPLVIKLATGTYDVRPTILHDCMSCGDRPLSILGGYNSTCTTRSEDPRATVLTTSATGIDAGLSIRTDGDVVLDRLSIVDFSDVFLNTESAFSADYSLRISRVLFDRVGFLRIPGNELILIENSVFWRGGREPPFCPVEIGYISSAEQIVLRNNTFVANQGPAALCIGTTAGALDWTLNLTNNIFRDNGAVDIRLRKPASYLSIPATIRHNIYANLTSNPPLAAFPVSTLNVDPAFLDPIAGDFRLQGGSLAINSGRIDSNLLAQRDFAGGQRWFGEAPDRGAFESNIGSTATVLTVTSTNDAGPGSLRQALIDANAAPNFNEIRFNISGACPRTITLASLLPDIIHPVRIDGYTQPGSARNSAVLGWNANLCVVLNGNNQITGAFGFNVNTGASPDATVSIEGIAFSGHSFAAMQFVGGRDHRFVGNQIGGVVGSTLLPSATGVRIGGTVDGVRVGGPEPADRNVIADALGIGVNISGSGSTQPTNAVVENNYIGTQSGGDSRGNQRGVFIAAPDHVIRNNVIAESVSHGIDLSGSLAVRNRITGNRIGVPALCFGSCPDRGNGGHGVLLRNNANDNRIDDNLIAWNSLDGIAVTGARHNSLRRNTFYEHGGIAIDLGDDGRNLFNANNSQPAPADAGNDDQNAPSFTAFAGTPAQGWASGSLTSSNGWYRIDFHGIPSGTGCTTVLVGGLSAGNWGEGRDWLGSTWVQISNGTATTNGNASFTDVVVRREGSSNYFVAGTTWITATATRLSGPPLLGAYSHLGTSEFGRCRQYVAGSGPDPLFKDGFEAGGS